MANCEEISCTNVQSAICLHCHHSLCVTHIVAHGTLLLKEGDQLCEQINELAQQLNVCLQQIHTDREEATNILNIWRQNQIDKLEYKFAEKIQDIEFRKNHLTDLENELTQRLIKEVKQPLEYMQTRQNASSQNLQIIRQVIGNIIQNSAQLDVCLKDSSNQSSASSIVNPTGTDKNYLLQSNSAPQQYASNKTQYFINSTINPADLQTLTTNQLPLNQTASAIASKPVSNQATTMQTIVTPSATSKLPPTTASVTFKKFNIKRPPINFCKNLVISFQNVSGSTDRSIEHYIVNNLNEVVHVNNLMVLLLSFLEAWHSSKSPTIFNPSVQNHHINLIKKYIKGSEHQLTVIAAMQVHINSCNYEEKKSSEMMTDLLRFFFDHQCISKEIILDWHKNGAQYGYAAFHKAKQWANLFIDQLNT